MFSPGETEKLSTELSDAEKDRLERILFVRDYVAQGISMRRAAKELKVSRNTVRKYLDGDPKELCRQQTDCNFKCEHSIVPHLDFITDCVNRGMFPSEIHRELMVKFYYEGSFRTFYNHLKRNAKRRGWTLNTRNDPKGHTAHAPKMISRSSILDYLWNNGELSPEHKTFVFGQHSTLFVLERCIREFRAGQKILCKRNYPTVKKKWLKRELREAKHEALTGLVTLFRERDAVCTA